MIATLRSQPRTTHARRSIVLFLLVVVQASIGIGTLVMHVPMDMALTHQAFALVVLGFAAAHWRGTKGAYPLPHEIESRN
jgi:cytochrome c oxidase assembly protein subunit 15